MKKRKATSTVTPSTSSAEGSAAVVSSAPPTNKNSATGVSECKDEDSLDEEMPAKWSNCWLLPWKNLVNFSFIRWFKFTLKPPYSIMHSKLRLAIWDTSFWTFWLKFGQQGTLRHILWPILVIFEICQFLTISGPFEYFSENGWSQKIKVFSMKEQSLTPPYWFSFRRRGP